MWIAKSGYYVNCVKSVLPMPKGSTDHILTNYLVDNCKEP